MLHNIIKQGVTYNWRAQIQDYPYPASEGWSLRLVMNPRAGGAVITVDSTASGDDHLLQISSAVTATYAAGAYGYEIYAIKAGEQYDLEAGQLTVMPGLLVAPGGTDTRTDAEKALAAITAMLAGKASSAVESYRIAGRELRSYPLPDLLRLQQQLRRDVDAEKTAANIAAGLGGRRRFVVRM